jgi:hypothetical protein
MGKWNTIAFICVVGGGLPAPYVFTSLTIHGDLFPPHRLMPQRIFSMGKWNTIAFICVVGGGLPAP